MIQSTDLPSQPNRPLPLLAATKPLESRHGQADERASNDARTGDTASLGGGAEPCPLPMVMVVDDDLHARRSIARMLSPHAICRPVGSLNAAIEVVTRIPIAAAVVELTLSGSSALPLLRLIRQQRGTLPLLVVSATDNLLEVSSASQLGAAFVSKQLPVEQLRRALAQLVGRAAQHRDARSELVRRLGEGARLTPAEQQTLRLFAELGERGVLAEELGIAETSVRSRVRGICRKLGIDRLRDVFRLLFEESLAA